MQCIYGRLVGPSPLHVRAILLPKFSNINSLHNCSVLYNTTHREYTPYTIYFLVYLVKWVYNI